MFDDDDLMLDLLARRAVDGNAVETTREAGQRADVRIDRRAAVVFDQIVVDVNPIHRGAGGVHLVEKGKKSSTKWGKGSAACMPSWASVGDTCIGGEAILAMVP
jgi:hypothetical protein